MKTVLIRRDMIRLGLLTCIAIVAVAAAAYTQDKSIAEAKPERLAARVVLFIPEDAEPPEDYVLRIQSLALKAEDFLASGMKKWNLGGERREIFARSKEGKILVTLTKGTVDSSGGRAALPSVRRTAIDAASTKLQLNEDTESVWWIFYDYPGVQGFQGAGSTSGGVAINKYPAGKGKINPSLELSAPEFAEASIKGAIHELGHALGLPHIGPRPDRNLGNSLMGPVTRAYARTTNSDDPRVYLSEASAALLNRHPIFQKNPQPSPEMPDEVEISDLKVEESEDGSSIVVAGRLNASLPADTAIVFDVKRPPLGKDYWSRGYTSAIKKDGTFRIVVQSPFGAGNLSLTFCFENGCNTADGKRAVLRGSVIEIPYSGEAGDRVFTIPKQP
jgi:hypothetical protein